MWKLKEKREDNKAGRGKQSLKGVRRGGAAVPTDKGHVFGVAEAVAS